MGYKLSVVSPFGEILLGIEWEQVPGWTAKMPGLLAINPLSTPFNSVLFLRSGWTFFGSVVNEADITPD